MFDPGASTLAGLLAAAVLVAGGLTGRAPAESPPDAESRTDAETSDAADDPSESAEPGPIRRRKLSPRSRVPDDAVDKLRSKIDRILERRVASEANVGIVAVDTRTGQKLYGRNTSATFNPASNMKLFTSATALDRFGPSHTFETELLAGERNDDRIEGGLSIRGEGEAFLLFEDVIAWAAKLRAKGIERIEGGLIVDDTVFDGAYLPPAFDQKEEDASYRAPIGAVSVNFNAVTAIANPGSETGDKPDLRTFPPNDHVEIDNRAETVAGGGRNLVFKSEPTDEGATVVIVEGSIGVEAREMRSRLRIDHPPAYAGSIVRRALSMVDIEVQGPVRAGETPSGAEVVVSHSSQPLSYVVLAMNKWSNNFMAEQLLRTLGVEDDTASTWERARASVRSFVEKVGIDPGELTIKNGSGLYDGNEVAPDHVARLLTHMLDHRAGPEFVSSLAIAGTDGTLDSRMDDPPLEGNLRAKTGTLNDVSALSGYVHTVSDRVVAFSMLFDETPRRAWHYRSVQDDIARAIARLDK